MPSYLDFTDADWALVHDSEPVCFDCHKPASELIPEGVWRYELECDSAAAAAREDGTYNPRANVFACDRCYIRHGCPSGPNGWMPAA